MRRLSFGQALFRPAIVLLTVALGAAVVAKERAPLAALFWGHMAIHGMSTNEKVVALTFDDGPHPVFTPQVLRILDSYHVKATFFMIGSRMEQYPDVVREVVARGHAIGNHTYTHPHEITACTHGELVQELERCQRVIQKLTGKRTHLFRPPRGHLDYAVLKVAGQEEYKTILWLVAAGDRNAPTPELMAQRVEKYIRPGGIILLHDGRIDSRWKDVAATPLIIQSLLKQGYRFVTVPELLEIEGRAHASLSVVSGPVALYNR